MVGGILYGIVLILIVMGAVSVLNAATKNVPRKPIIYGIVLVVVGTAILMITQWFVLF